LLTAPPPRPSPKAGTSSSPRAPIQSRRIGNIFFGFFGFFIFLFLFFGLLRLAFGGGRGGWGRHGSYGRGPNGWADGEARSWEERARQAHDAWHRDHPDTPGSPTTGGQAG
jgi:hypothetical protein